MSKNKKIIVVIIGLLLLPVIGILSLFAYLFSGVIIEEFASIETKSLPQKNPTSYTFKGNLEDVRKKIVPALDHPEFESPFPFKAYDGLETRGYEVHSDFYICEAGDDICLGTNDKKVEEIFKKKENQKDIYLASDGIPIFSSTYYMLGKPLKFRTDFHIHLEATEDEKTKITIAPINPVIYKGYGGTGLHGAILQKQIPVEATTVEEYQLLRYIGFVLGEKDMPEVILSK